MQSTLIILLAVLAAMAYGIVHDQVTARVCVEYFTIGHPPLFGTEDPTLLGLGWGVLATWWAGLMIGVPAAVVARAGRLPRRSAASLVRPTAILLAIMSVSALVAGTIGWLLASAGVVFLVGHLADDIPADRHGAFIADLWAHTASYLVGFVGGLVVMALIWRSRIQAGTDMGHESLLVGGNVSSPL